MTIETSQMESARLQQKRRERRRLGLILAVALIGIGAQAGAAVKWSFNYSALDPLINNACSSSLVSGQIHCGSFSGVQGSPTIPGTLVPGPGPTPPTVSVTGWADTGSAGDGTSNNRLRQGQVHSYSGGLGVRWQGSNPTSTGDDEVSSSPEHSMDNCGSYSSGTCGASTPEEMVLLAFSAPVVLSEVAVGWASSDSDITLLAYMPGGTPAAASSAPNLTDRTYSHSDSVGGNTVGLINDGWKWVGHYVNLHSTCTSGSPSNCSTSNPGKAAVNTGTAITNQQAVSGLAGGQFASSFWLVGAYNSRVNSTNPGWTSDNDFMKLVSVTATVCTPPPVPEPHTALLGALGMVMGARKLKRARR